MLNLIQFELTKLMKSKFFQLMLLISSIFVLTYFVFIYTNTIRANDLQAESEAKIINVSNVLAELEESIKKGEVKADDEEVVLRITDLKGIIEEHKVKLNGYKNEDWMALLDMELDHLEPIVKRDLANFDYYTSTWQTLFTTETNYEQYKWMREHEIIPVYPINSLAYRTAYDVVYDLPGLEESIKKLSTKYSSTGIYYVHHLFSVIFSVFGASFFLLLFGDIVTRERLGTSGPIQLLRSQPIRRGYILVSKFVTVVIATLLILFGIGVFALLLGTIFDRLGHWNYPVLIYGEKYSFYFMNMSTFLTKSMILFIMVLLFCYALLFLFSVLTKRVPVAISLVLATLFLGMNMSEASSLSAFAPYIPFHYFSVSKVVTNELAVTMKNFTFSFSTGMTTLALATVLVLMATFLLATLQEKLIVRRPAKIRIESA